MSIPSRPIVIRIPRDAYERFQKLCHDEFPGLQMSAVMRMLVLAQLELPMAEQAEIVLRQIKRPEGKRIRREQSDRTGKNANRMH